MVKSSIKKGKKKRFLKPSKTRNFLRSLKEDNSMVEYLSHLNILSSTPSTKSSPKEGGFVTLAHARDEFTAPEISKGKSQSTRKRQRR